MSGLVSHGYYSRSYIDEIGVRHQVQVPRVRCRSCRQAFSCLYEFLIPYRRYGLEAFAVGLFCYLTKLCSYTEALWESGTEMEASTVFRAISVLRERIYQAQLQLQLKLINAGVDLLGQALPVFCLNADKARIRGKGADLKRAAEVLSLAKAFLQGDPIVSLCRMLVGINEGAFHLLAGGNARLSSPHYTQCLLF